MGNEDCVQFVSVKGHRDGWHDVDCRFKKKYVCTRKLCGTGKGQEPASTRFLTRTLRVPLIFVRARNSATKILSSLVSYFLSPMIAGFCQNIRQIWNLKKKHFYMEENWLGSICLVSVSFDQQAFWYIQVRQGTMDLFLNQRVMTAKRTV